MRFIKIIPISVAVLCFTLQVSAQETVNPAPESEQKDIDFVEKLLETNSVEFKNAPSRNLNPSQKKQKAEYGGVTTESFYSDLAIIQKNYMPKSERMLLSGGFTLLPSDVFYRTFGANLKASYHFNETWGAEAFAYAFTSSERDEVNKLESVQKLSVKTLVSVTSFYGVNLYFDKIYGKTALLNSRILPFEIYQTIGVGKIRTQNSDESTTFQFGIGDLFSLTRSSALRIDLTWAFYTAHNYLGQDQSANSMFLTFSYGHFFPEPSYR